jgi:hypothetical protein
LAATLAASSVSSLRLWVGVMAGEGGGPRTCLVGVVGERRRGELVSSPRARLMGLLLLLLCCREEVEEEEPPLPSV